MAALVSQHPSATLELLAYMITIVKASQQYDGLYWRAYDTNYRLTASATGNRNWSRLDTDLFTRLFTGRARFVGACSVSDSVSHSSEDFPEALSTSGKHPARGRETKAPDSKRRKFSRTRAPHICAEFNAKGVCSFGTRCKFRHVCGNCSKGDHPAKSYPSKL